MGPQRLELSLVSHPGQALISNGTCFLPWVPCIPFLFCACFSEYGLGPEHNAMKVWDLEITLVASDTILNEIE